jgi:hypothetical protein
MNRLPGRRLVPDAARPGTASWWGAVAICLLAAVWILLPWRQLPLYDGVGFPDEPYRWVVPPSGSARTEAPTDAVARALVHGGVSADLVAQSQEQGPQVQVWAQYGDLVLPAGATTMTVTAVPVAPVPPPTGSLLCSNVYRITVTTSAGPAKIGPAHDAVAIMLRAAVGTCSSATLEHHTTGGWTPLPTDRTGQDIWGALLPQFGDYALVAPLDTDTAAGSDRAAGSTPSGSGTPRLLLLGTGMILLILALSILVVRRSRTPPASR